MTSIVGAVARRSPFVITRFNWHLLQNTLLLSESVSSSVNFSSAPSNVATFPVISSDRSIYLSRVRLVLPQVWHTKLLSRRPSNKLLRRAFWPCMVRALRRLRKNSCASSCWYGLSVGEILCTCRVIEPGSTTWLDEPCCCGGLRELELKSSSVPRNDAFESDRWYVGLAPRLFSFKKDCGGVIYSRVIRVSSCVSQPFSRTSSVRCESLAFERSCRFFMMRYMSL
mmetsp:Transcript_32810/g.78371  ORF Transcript_32810/g.78371 Transcript_32810/m.78371 type:complete len:226 (-) Transcript_32810:1023-1700(-)